MNSEISDLSYRWTTRGATILLFLSGLIHLFIIPHHWAHARAHGIFMGTIGVVELIWGIVYWLRPTNRLAQVGAIISIGCITLWGITRIFPAPFGMGPEELDAIGMITKVLEAGATFLLLGAIMQPLSSQRSGYRMWRTVIPVILLAVFLGFGAYQVARASEPLFPWLMASEVHELEHSPEPEAPDDDHEHEILSTS